MQQLGDFAIERCEAAFVLADQGSVDRKDGFVVCRADMKKDTVMLARLVVEIPLIPDHPFVIEERIALRVPVARHSKRGRFAEIVLHQLVVTRNWRFIQHVSVVTHYMMKG